MNIIKSDLYRIVRSTTFWVCLLITSICAVLITVISHFIATGTFGQEFIGTASGLMDNMIINIAAPMVIATYLCGDFQNKTIHDAILYGHGRKAIIWSKFVPFVVVVMVLVLPYAVCTLIGFVMNGTFSLDFANAIDSSYMMMLAKKAEFSVNLDTILKLLLCLLVLGIMYCSRISLIFLLAVKIRKPVPVVGIGILLEIGLGIMAAVANGNEVVKACLGWTPFTTMRDTITLQASVPELLRMAGTSIVFMLIIINITVLLFRKTEVK